MQKKLFFDMLLPLLRTYGENFCWVLVSEEAARHKPNEWLLWDRQTPMISMYHKDVLMTPCADALNLQFPHSLPCRSSSTACLEPGARESERRTRNTQPLPSAHSPRLLMLEREPKLAGKCVEDTIASPLSWMTLA